MPSSVVSLITGGLGSGKTSLINQLLRTGPHDRVAIVVNEFGEVGIDHLLFETSSERVTLLPGGCLCCSYKSDLNAALARLEFTRKVHGRPALEQVLIETSGLAAPGPIVELFTKSVIPPSQYQLAEIICLVDSRLGTQPWRSADHVAGQQVMLADRVVLTKTDLISDEMVLEKLRTEIKKANPYAIVQDGLSGLTLKNLLTAEALQTASLLTSKSNAIEQGVPFVHDQEINQFALHWEVKAPKDVMIDWLTDLAMRLSSRLMRVKGLVLVPTEDSKGSSQVLSFQMVGESISAPQLVNLDLSKSVTVFIGRGIEPIDVLPPWPAWVSTQSARVRN